jgi:hypothetical protein
MLGEMGGFTKIDEVGHLQTYELSGQSPLLGTVLVNSLRFTTFEKKLGRVTVRYTGQTNHAKILGYLESTYGPGIVHQAKLALVRSRSIPGMDCPQK